MLENLEQTIKYLHRPKMYKFIDRVKWSSQWLVASRSMVLSLNGLPLIGVPFILTCKSPCMVQQMPMIWYVPLLLSCTGPGPWKRCGCSILAPPVVNLCPLTSTVCTVADKTAHPPKHPWFTNVIVHWLGSTCGSSLDEGVAVVAILNHKICQLLRKWNRCIRLIAIRLWSALPIT